MAVACCRAVSTVGPVSWRRRTGTSRMRDVGCVMLYSSTTRHYPQNCKVKGALGRQSPPLIIQPHAARSRRGMTHVMDACPHDVIGPGAGHVPGPFRIRGRHTARLRLGFLFSRAAPGRPQRSFFPTFDFRLKFSTQHAFYAELNIGSLISGPLRHLPAHRGHNRSQ